MKKLCILLVLFSITLNTTQAQQILKPTEPNEACIEAWQNYHKADVLWKTGWGLFGAGLGVAVGGAILGSLTIQDHLPPSERDQWIANQAGFYTMIAGAGITAASIPCLAVGQVRRKAAMNMYNESGCQQEQPLVQFSIQTSSNGLGLAMHF